MTTVGDGPVADLTGAAFDEVISVNLRGAAFVTSAAWQSLVTSRGSIVIVSTGGLITANAIADVVTFFCSPGSAAAGQVLAVDAGWGLDSS